VSQPSENRILLIEDDPTAQLLYSNRLNDLGYDVVSASTGALGLMEARSAPFDLFLVDIDLGKGIDGYEVCQRLKGIPEIRAVPVVLISSHVKAREDLHRGYEAGCQSFLVKGDLMLLEDVVRAMLRIKSLQEELALQNRLIGRVEAEKGRAGEVAAGTAGAPVFPEPEGLLLVDGDGVVVTSDRGARDLFGQAIEGKHLAVLAPGSRLEAAVRNAPSGILDGVRFEIPERTGRPARAMLAHIHPFVPNPNPTHPALRLVVVSAAQRRGGSEVPVTGERTLPRAWHVILEAAHEVYRPSALRGTSHAMRELRARVRHLSLTEGPILLRGPSGSGKSFTARTLHFSGARSGPLVVWDCVTAAEDAQAGLFGEEGDGAVLRASGGTLYLRDLERLAPGLQRRLLEVLTTGRVHRASGASERADVRLIASTRVPSGRPTGLLPGLEERFSGATLSLPPLAERKEDLELLARHFLERAARHEEADFAPEVLEAFTRHDWPDNVRELELTVRRAAAGAGAPEIQLADLPPAFQELGRGTAGAPRTESGTGLEKQLGLLRSSLDATVSLLDAYEKGAILHALELSRGDKLSAAKLLRIGKSTFYRKLKEHGIR